MNLPTIDKQLKKICVFNYYVLKLSWWYGVLNNLNTIERIKYWIIKARILMIMIWLIK